MPCRASSSTMRVCLINGDATNVEFTRGGSSQEDVVVHNERPCLWRHRPAETYLNVMRRTALGLDLQEHTTSLHVWSCHTPKGTQKWSRQAPEAVYDEDLRSSVYHDDLRNSVYHEEDPRGRTKYTAGHLWCHHRKKEEPTHVQHPNCHLPRQYTCDIYLLDQNNYIFILWNISDLLKPFHVTLI